MKKDSFISVIVVNYNGRNFIGECLESLLSSTYQNFEIVIVDNDSTDGSFAYLGKKYGRNKKVKILRSEKQLHFTGGCNFGAKKARGRKLFFLNSDTAIDKNCLKELVEFTFDYPKYLVQPRILQYNAPHLIDNVGGRYSFWGFGYGIGRGEKDKGQYKKNRQIDFVNGTAFLIDQDFFWSLGGFDEQFKYFYEDVDLCLRAKKAGGQCWYCSKSIMYHKGSLTFKQNLSKYQIASCIRRNRLLTLWKNQKNVSLLIKLPALILITIWLSLNDQVPAYLINRLRLWELKRMVKKKRFTLLDLGCGDGSFVKLALHYGIDALGVDKHSIQHPKVIISSIENLRLDKKSNVITMFHVLEHLKRPKEILRKVKTLLTDDGLLVLEVPLIENLTNKFLGRDYFAYDDKTHCSFFSKKTLFRLLHQAGFQIVKKGITLYEFPFTVMTTSFKKKGLLYGFFGMILFVPFKVLSITGLNDEIIRVYCRPSHSCKGTERIYGRGL